MAAKMQPDATERVSAQSKRSRRTQSIGISGCVGAGVFVSSGSSISTAGSLGAPIAYLVAGGTVACVLYTLTGMVACRPVAGSLIDLPHNFLDPAWGFAVGASYANICSMATLTAQSAELTALLKTKQERHEVAVEAAINVAFIALTTFSHCLGVKFYGLMERIIMWLKLCLLVLVCIFMIVINAGGAGPRQGSYKANYTTHAFTPGWKPTGFDNTVELPLQSHGVIDSRFGLGGSGGQFFAFLTAVTLAMFSCMGGELIAMTAGEAKDPWRDVPLAQSFVYLVPLSIYPFALVAAGSNVNYADPQLSKPFSAGKGPFSQSPFVIAAQNSSLHALPRVLNPLFVISAYTAARTVFVLSQQYLPQRFANIFGRTNNGHTPLASILLCSTLGFLSLFGLSQYAFSQAYCDGSQVTRLERLEARQIFSRDDTLYILKLFRSRWQPLPAYIGIVACVIFLIWSGIPPLYILAAKGGLTSSSNLKSTVALIFDVIGVYLGPVVFVTFYFAYKWRTKCSSVDIRNLTPEDYVLENRELLIEDSRSDGGKVFDASDIRPGAIQLASPDEERVVTALRGEYPQRQNQNADIENDEDWEEYEERKADQASRRRVCEILEGRPERMKGGFWRVVWSFVVVEKKAKAQSVGNV
ncbi:hypothetical protein CC78DRAFT_564091 [Lojkania enalia]|uniref:Amino acid permease/ SLC12A domain-containing protein n=1 Tax=Lojkania enalia TaxID=147567 RepID=A0A9P4NB88_9PLEO|nr:hypothetical protein CC78DRAFT_564091 [Didymosphaeria enalia]